jgi:hypothetical protein
MFGKLITSPPAAMKAQLHSALLHVCTMAITFPLTIGVGSLLGWHVYIVLNVRRSHLHLSGAPW